MANQCLTATTTYPCFGQDLGDSAGAGSTDLPMQRYKIVHQTTKFPPYLCENEFLKDMYKETKSVNNEQKSERMKERKKFRHPFILSLFHSFALSFFVLSCNSSDKYVEQGRSYLKEGKFREAVQALNQAIEADHSDAEAFNSRGVAYFELKEYANATLDYDQAIKLQPDFYRPYYNRGLLKVAQNDLTGALKDYSDAIRLAPDTSKQISAELFLNRGQLFASQGQLQPAMTDFSQAITLDSKNALALYNRGNLRFQQKDLTGAISDFQQAIKADPKFGKAFYGLGIAQVLNNERESACLSLKQAQALGYADAANAVAEYCK